MAIPMVSQKELVENLAGRLGWSASDVRAFLSALQEEVVEAIENCNRIKVAGVQIEPKLRPKSKARMGRNPATGEAVKIAAKPASVKIKARVLAALTNQVDLPSTKKFASVGR